MVQSRNSQGCCTVLLSSRARAVNLSANSESFYYARQAQHTAGCILEGVAETRSEPLRSRFPTPSLQRVKEVRSRIEGLRAERSRETSKWPKNSAPALATSHAGGFQFVCICRARHYSADLFFALWVRCTSRQH